MATFDPTNKTLLIERNQEDEASQIAAHVLLRLSDTNDLVESILNEDAVNWSDTKILAYVYLQALYHRGCTINQRYSESIFTLVTNTLLAVCEQDDFTRADWSDVKLEFADLNDPQPLYLTVTTEDGYDLTIRYMSPGVAWQEVVVRHDESVPLVAELRSQLFHGSEKEWVSNGSIVYDGMTYKYDQAASAIFTAERRLEVLDENGGVIYTGDTLVGPGVIDAIMGLHRSLQLGLNYGSITELTTEQRQALTLNVAHTLQDLFGMGEYLELQDGTSHSVRGMIDNDLSCLITHTYLAEADKIRADFRFFTLAQNWSVERSELFSFDQPSVDVMSVYAQHHAQIRAGLGLDLPEPEINQLADIPFDNRDVGQAPAEPLFTPLTPEEQVQYEYEEAADMAGDPLEVTMVAAVGPNGGLGVGNNLLFRIKEDLQFFKQVTSNHVVIMGRKTFESIGKPLPNRQNIVITSDPEYVLNLYTPENDKQHDNLHCVTSVEEAIMLGGRLAATVYGNNELMVIGGGEIYREFMPMASKILLTSVNNGDDSQADVFFPLSGDEMIAQWIATILSAKLQEGDLVYDRYELTRKQ